VFGSDILDFGVSNINIKFNSLGRSTYNKWKNFDMPTVEDTNNFDEIYTELDINLAKPYTKTAPAEYVNWANQNKITPIGNNLGLANFYKLEENLTQYRKMFYNNFRLSGNYFILC
jgi:hypothetical protein